MTKGTPDDRRKAQRVEILLKVEYLYPRDLLHDYITDLGEGGMFIHTPVAFRPGDALRFNLSFPGLLAPIELQGVVRWRQSPEESEMAGVGIEFGQPIPPVLKDIISAFKLDGEPKAESTFNVLLVEDNAFVQELFTFAIRRLDADHITQSPLQTLCASDGEQGLSMLESSRVDLAIVDHFLPGISGCELIHRYRKSESRDAHLPILMVSVGGEEVRRRAYECGADLYLDKPVLHTELRSALIKLLALPQVEGSQSKRDP
jgi:uncharacterized protein (TIGR02266 family)